MPIDPYPLYPLPHTPLYPLPHTPMPIDSYLPMPLTPYPPIPITSYPPMPIDPTIWNKYKKIDGGSFIEMKNTFPIERVKNTFPIERVKNTFPYREGEKHLSYIFLLYGIKIFSVKTTVTPMSYQQGTQRLFYNAFLSY